jgi:hypothetical protein
MPASPITAVSITLSRVFDPVNRGRIMLVGLALIAVSLFSEIARMCAAGVAMAVFKAEVLGVAAGFVVNAITVPLMIAIAVVLSFDLRVRREGYDLALESAALAST